VSQRLGQPVSGPLVLSIGAANVAKRGVKTQASDYAYEPAVTTGMPDSLALQTASLALAARTSAHI
jgi:hypothetical protein